MQTPQFNETYGLIHKLAVNLDYFLDHPMESHDAAHQRVLRKSAKDLVQSALSVVIDSPPGLPNPRLVRAAGAMYAALKMAGLGIHLADDYGPCLCSECEFSKAAADAIALAESPL